MSGLTEQEATILSHMNDVKTEEKNERIGTITRREKRPVYREGELQRDTTSTQTSERPQHLKRIDKYVNIILAQPLVDTNGKYVAVYVPPSRIPKTKTQIMDELKLIAAERKRIALYLSPYKKEAEKPGAGREEAQSILREKEKEVASYLESTKKRYEKLTVLYQDAINDEPRTYAQPEDPETATIYTMNGKDFTIKDDALYKEWQKLPDNISKVTSGYESGYLSKAQYEDYFSRYTEYTNIVDKFNEMPEGDEKYKFGLEKKLITKDQYTTYLNNFKEVSNKNKLINQFNNLPANTPDQIKMKMDWGLKNDVITNEDAQPYKDYLSWYAMPEDNTKWKSGVNKGYISKELYNKYLESVSEATKNIPREELFSASEAGFIMRERLIAEATAKLNLPSKEKPTIEELIKDGIIKPSGGRVVSPQEIMEKSKLLQIDQSSILNTQDAINKKYDNELKTLIDNGMDSELARDTTNKLRNAELNNIVLIEKRPDLGNQNVGYVLGKSELTESELKKLKQAGIIVTGVPIVSDSSGWSKKLYEWGKQHGDAWSGKTDNFVGGLIDAETQAFAAVLGTSILNPVETGIEFASAIIRNEKFVPSQKFSIDNIREYEKNLPPQIMPILYGGGVGATLLTSYVAALPAGIATSRIISLAKNIVIAKNGVASTSAVASVLSKITKNKLLMQGLIWGPAVGIESIQVYNDYERGLPMEDILGRLAIRGAMFVGATKGFEKGMTSGLTKAEIKVLEKIKTNIKTKQITATGTSDFAESFKQTEMTVQGQFRTKQIPKDVAEIIKEGTFGMGKIDENTQIAGLIKMRRSDVGSASQLSGGSLYSGSPLDEFIEMPVTIKYGKITEELVKGKSVGISEYKMALQKILTPEEMTYLYMKNGDPFRMSPQDLAMTLYKEFGYGSPWDFKKPMDFMRAYMGQTTGDIKVLGLVNITEDVAPGSIEGIVKAQLAKELEKGIKPLQLQIWKGTTLVNAKEVDSIARGTGIVDVLMSEGSKEAAVTAKNGYTSLVKQGISEEQALKYVLSGLKKDNISNTLAMISTSTLTPQQIQAVATVTMALSTNQLSKSFSELGVPKNELESTMSILLDPKTFSTEATNLSAKSLSYTIPFVSAKEMSSVETPTLINIMDKVDIQTMSKLIPKINPISMDDVVVKLSIKPAILLDVFDNMNEKERSLVFGHLNEISTNKIVSNLSTKPDAITGIFNKLDHNTLTKIIPKLDTSTITDIISKVDIATLTEIIPMMDKLTITEIIPILTEIQILTVLPLLPFDLREDIKKQLRENKKKQPNYEVTFIFTKKAINKRVIANSFREALSKTWNNRGTLAIPRQVDVSKI
jgi:hypothetical protein